MSVTKRTGQYWQDPRWRIVRNLRLKGKYLKAEDLIRKVKSSYGTH